MELTLSGAVPWLIGRKLVPARAVVDAQGDRVEARDYTRRNRNVKVLVPGREGVLLKQAMDPASPELADGLAREAAVLRAIAREPTLAPLRRVTPRFLRFERRHALLATGLVHPATTLLRYAQTREPGVFPLEPARTVGHVLARVRVAGERAAREGRLRFLPREGPAALGIPAALERRAKADPHAAALRDALKGEALWTHALPAGNALVHGDARWDNFLLTAGAGPGGDLNVRLVDWEMARRGDPAWDLGYALAEHVRFWLVEGAAEDADDPARFAATARFGPETWRAAAAEMERAYATRARVPVDDLRPAVLRLLPLLLAVHAYEALPAAAQRPRLPLLAARLASEAHRDPQASAARLLGWDA